MSDQEFVPELVEVEGWKEELDRVAEEKANAAVASLCGLVLRRLQQEHLTRSPDRNAMEDVLDERLSEIFGEALQQFTADAGS